MRDAEPGFRNINDWIPFFNGMTLVGVNIPNPDPGCSKSI